MDSTGMPNVQDKEEKQSVRHWIEKDALKSLRQSLEGEELDATVNTEIGPRKAFVVAFGSGWTLAGLNLTFGRYATDHYPNLIISDGKHEVKAYLATEQAQSSAFWTTPTLAVGSLIRIEKAEFVEESSLLDLKKEGPVEAVAKSRATFVLAIRSTVQNLPRKPILNLNQSLKYRREVEQWRIRKTNSIEPREHALGETQIGIGSDNEDEKDSEDDDDSRSESSNESENISSQDGTEGVTQLTNEMQPETPKTAARRKHKRKLIQSNSNESASPLPPPAKKGNVGSAGRGRPSKLSWEDKLEHMKVYKAENGHCNAPVGYKQGGFALGSWINQLRMGKGSLTDDQKRQLNELGFIYDMADYNWQRNFECLVEYKREHGHTCVPISFKDPVTGNLGTWVYNQRRAKRSDKLLPDRKEKLNQIEFEWDVRRGKRPS